MKSFLIELGIVSLLMAAVIALLSLFSNKMKDRLSASCRYIIWLVVIVRLAIPFGGVIVPSLISIPVDNTSIEENAPVDIANENDGLVESMQTQNGIGNTESIPSEPMDSPAREPVYNGALATETENNGFEFNADTAAYVLFAVWVAGAVVFCTVNVIRYNGIKEAMRRNLTETDGRVAEIYGELCREMRIKKAPVLYSSPLAQSPMLCGYFKKKIIVPRLSVSESSLRAVLTHELTHHKRGDIWAKLLALVANSIHWFNPAVYAAVARFNSEMELSCDEKTLFGKNEEERVEYGRTMLDIVSRCRGGETVLTTKFNPKKNASGERINNILDTRKKGKGIIVIAITVLTCIIAGVIIGCEVVKGDENDKLPYNADTNLSNYTNDDTVASDTLNDDTPEEIGEIDSLAGVGDDVKNAAKALLSKDTATLENLTGCASGVLSAYKDFKFDSYSYKATDDGRIEMDLDISYSSLDTVPAGKYCITVGYGLYGVDISGFVPVKNNLKGEGASFVYSWVLMMGDPVIPENDADVADKENYHKALVDFMFQQIGEVSPEKYRDMAKKMFGIEDLMIPEGFINEDGNVYVGGHGGYVRSFEIVSEEVSGDTITVTVQTYADHMRTVKSRLIKNTFKKIDGVLSVVDSEVIEDNGYEEIGYLM